jgi:hypothetical protein
VAGELDVDGLSGAGTRGKRLARPVLARTLPVMTTLAPGDRFRLWPTVWPLVRILVLSALPVPDLPGRLKVRHAARGLARGCDPWPGMQASGADAARLALHRLLHLQRATHRAVLSRQDEAATMLARVMIETYITGMYCLYEPGAVAKLQNGQLKMLQPMLEFLREDGGILSGVPRDVLDECIRRLDAGTPADGPKVWVMAEKVDTATGSTIAISLYNRFYRPTSNLAIHAGAASLLRHVRGDGKITRKPSRIWGRRTPARIADACLGGLTAFLADREGSAWQRTARHAATYADRHHERAIPPVTAISLRSLGRGLRLSGAQQVAQAIARVCEFGQYVQSGQDAEDPPARAARIRSEFQDLLAVPALDVPPGSLDPFIDYMAEKIVAETQPPTAPN